MAYNQFTLGTLSTQLGLHVRSAPEVFAGSAPVAPGGLLQETLAEFVPLALDISTEKARSEFIIAPVLAEVRRHFPGQVSLFSGVEFTVDVDAGLNGVCDFLLSLSPMQLIVQAPVLAVVEAKNDNLKSGLGQCLAELVAAQRFNAQSGLQTPTLCGVVTTGSLWKFLRLHDTEATIDETEYHISQLERILGILVAALQEALTAHHEGHL